MKSLLPIALFALFAGLLSAQKTETKTEPQVVEAALDKEIKAAVTRIQFSVTPNIFSRRRIEPSEIQQIAYYTTVDTKTAGDVIPIHLTITHGSLARQKVVPVHYADGRFHRATKKLELKHIDLKTGTVSWVPSEKWGRTHHGTAIAIQQKSDAS